MSELQWTKDALRIPYTWIAQNIWRIVEVLTILALGGHIILTVQTQHEQDKRTTRIEKILACQASQQCTQTKEQSNEAENSKSIRLGPIGNCLH